MIDGRFRTWKYDAIALVLGVGGALLFLCGVLLPAEAQDSRSLQVWPDRNIGVTSGLLQGSEAHASTQVLSLGASRTSGDEVVYARTYLHFPIDVFPPGTEILHATLYMVVDSSSGEGETALGVYRALEPWETGDWSGDPTTWPDLLTSPIAVTTVRFEVMTPTLPISVTAPITAPTATPSPTPVPTVTPTVTPTADEALLATPPTSPLSTPPPKPTPTPTPTPTPVPSLASTDDVPVIPLGQVAATWLSWDVTALVRAWLAGEIADDGLVLSLAPDPAVAPEEMDGLLVARYLSAADFDTRPYLIAEFEVHPVTPTPPTSPLPTPTSAPWPVLPPAGSSADWRALGLLLIGAACVLLGLMRWKRG